MERDPTAAGAGGRVPPVRQTRVDVLVVSYDHRDEIEPCVRAALNQHSQAIAVEVRVIDNASSDGTIEHLESQVRDPRLHVTRLAENRGFAAANNLGFDACQAELVLLLNPDCVMQPGCVRKLVDHLADHQGVGIVAAGLRWPDGRAQAFARRELDLRGVLLTMTEIGRRIDGRRGGAALRARRYEEAWGGDEGPQEPLTVDCPAAACILVRRELLEPRPFDERLPLFFNDAELARRTRKAGRAAVVVPEAVAVHGYGTSIRRIDQARRRAEWIVSLRRYVRPEWPQWERAALVLALVLDAYAGLLLQRAGRGRGDTDDLARGTLGGLGILRQPAPWLSPRPRDRRTGLPRSTA